MLRAPGLPLHLRVFISSPGDVAEERATAREVIEQLQREEPWRGRVTIQAIAWDDPRAGTPLDAHRSPQESVYAYNTRPAECDLTIVILWSRFGSPLNDGSGFRSGTEAELADARAAERPCWIYQRTEPFHVPADELDKPEVQEAARQYKAVKEFCKSFRNPDGSWSGGLHPYAAPSNFRLLLRQHLSAELSRRLPQQAPADAAFRVFVASAADDMQVERVRLLEEWKNRTDVQMLPERPIPPPLEKKEHVRYVRSLIKDSHVSVHFVGASAGALVANDTESSYLAEQLRVGMDSARVQLVLEADGLNPTDARPQAYKAALEELLRRRAPTLRLVSGGSDALSEELTRAREELTRSLSPAEGKVRRVFVDAHEEDQASAAYVIAHLRAARMEVSTLDPVFSSPSAQVSSFEREVDQADVVLMVVGRAPLICAEERLKAAREQIVIQRAATKCALYRVPSAGRSQKGANTDRPVSASAQAARPLETASWTPQLDQSHLNSFDLKELDRFIESLLKPDGAE